MLSRALAALLCAALLLAGAPAAAEAASPIGPGAPAVLLPRDGVEVAAPGGTHRRGDRVWAEDGHRSAAALPPGKGDHRTLRDLPEVYAHTAPSLPAPPGPTGTVPPPRDQTDRGAAEVSALPLGRAPPPSGTAPVRTAA
ncbi:hypothetical protein [Nocardiopsis suaedae]|uniref:Uncharacterized protein n=1 Tax=Nocardiopsis suaedae TaxID=3018444 RepID=A0ABT4TMW1_9ACTN|nr:hypothetical protein [Nocardiopsis suaedae]MDA2805951.1 hypothetical protein [Nocardiopsis suaedae]